jgi:hypothetical protein
MLARVSITLATVAILVSSPAGLCGQDAAQEPAGDTARVVAISKKYPIAAGVLEFLYPTAGYAYAGNWSRGFPPALVRVTGAVLLAEFAIGYMAALPCTARCATGAAMYFGGTIWAVFDAGATATRTNVRKLEASGGISVYPTLGQEGFGVGARVPVGR